VTETSSQEERLEQLAVRKLGKVKVTGTKVKDAKGKEDRKNVLKGTSVKKTNKK
jgi:hypothetical protein